MIREPDRRGWFAPKRVGYGWRPVTWQGWLITVAPGAIVLLVVLLTR